MNEPFTLTIREEQSRAGVPLDRFLQIANSFRNITRDVNEVMNLDHEEAAKAEIVVVAAHSGSVIMDMEMREVDAAPYDVALNVLNTVVNGLGHLEREATRPPYFSDSALKQAEQIVRALDGGIGEIRIDRPNTNIVLTQRLGENVRRILSPRGGSISSVEGRFYRIDLRRREFGVYDAHRKQAITCTYQPERLDEIRALLGETVRVFGKARTDANGSIQRIELRLIQQASKPESRRSLEDLFGSDPEFTGGVDSVAYVRAYRGEQTTN